MSAGKTPKLSDYLSPQDRAVRFDRFLAEHGIELPETRFFRTFRSFFIYDIDAPCTLEDLAAAAGYCADYTSRMIRRHTGLFYRQFYTLFRVLLAEELLDNPALRVSQIASMLHYSTADYFSRVFRDSRGITPAEYRRRKKQK